MAILAVDAGTTGVTALIVDEHGTVRSRGYAEFPQHFPKPGWVEHDPEEIWDATLRAVTDARAASDLQLSAVGITNQRETVALWDRRTLRAIRPAIVWQDRRTADIVDELRRRAVEHNVRSCTGLNLDPYFSSTKLLWLQREEPDSWGEVARGRAVIGTIDSYLLARMTAGAVHATDATNASRTQLFNIRTGTWDEDLLDLFGVPVEALPQVLPSYGRFGITSPDAFLGLDLPVCGIAGDQQAAMFGQTAFSVGDVKCTYGTGAFVLMNTGTRFVESQHGLLGTVAIQHPNGRIDYALEGSVFVAGAAVQWLRDGLGIIKYSSEVEELASSVDSSDGVVFVPALAGLGAPKWDPYARGTIVGITRGTTSAHIARATLDAIAFQVRDVVDAMVADSRSPLTELRVDGGAAANDLLLQIQADVLRTPVIRSQSLEMTGLGAAFLAGMGSRLWSSLDELRATLGVDRTFTPASAGPDYALWQRAVDRSRNWID